MIYTSSQFIFHNCAFNTIDTEYELQTTYAQLRTIVVDSCIRLETASAIGIQNRRCNQETRTVILKPENQNM